MNKLDNVIFILGCGHSGTTILNKIIGNHRNIYSIDYETGILAKHIKNNSDEQIIKKLKAADKRIEYGKKWLCEKTPSHVYNINRIFQLINNPKIIVITRDGRDVIASLFKRFDNFDICVDRWIDDNIEWFNSNYKEYFHIFKYEKFVKNPEKELQDICFYIGESYDSNMLNYQKSKIELPENIFDSKIDGDNHSTLRLYQINQDLYDGSKRYIKDLTENQLDKLMLNDKFIDVMKKLNYFED
jgi:hypothetical protein